MVRHQRREWSTFAGEDVLLVVVESASAADAVLVHHGEVVVVVVFHRWLLIWKIEEIRLLILGLALTLKDKLSLTPRSLLLNHQIVTIVVSATDTALMSIDLDFVKRRPRNEGRRCTT